MKRNWSIAILILLLGLLVSGIAWAHHPRAGNDFARHGTSHHHGRFHHQSRVRIIVGVPLAWHYSFPTPYYGYVYPPVVVTPASPPVYIERSSEPAAGFWYYCSSAQGYYPYVRECPTGWQLVLAQPPAAP